MGRQSLTLSHQQCDAPAVSKRSLLGENNSQIFYCCVYGVFHGQIGSAVLAVHLPNFLATPQPSHCGCRVRNREDPDNAQRYSVH